MVKDYIIEGKDGPIRFKLFEALEPKLILVVIHGMQEHSGRYVSFAHKMAENGISVITSDLRGHGFNSQYGFGSDLGNIFLNIVDDQKRIIKWAQKEFNGLEVAVLGHSYGSFVAQRLIRDRVGVNNFILSGSSYMKGGVVSAGRRVARITKFCKGRDVEAKLIERMGINSYRKKFENGNWLTRDENVWEDYLNDPMCGNPFPVSFYLSMFVELPKNYSRLKNSVGYRPVILLIAGKMDPVGKKGRGVKRLAKTYRNAGFVVDMKLYDGARHEVLNETNKDEVIKDILKFLG